MEDYDDYYEEGEGQYAYADEYEEEVEEEEEEKIRKPSAEELQYLEFRQRIKEQIRKKMQRENGSKSSQNKRLPADNYGSFFGPSQPVIAERVIQESKPLLENPRIAARVVNGYSTEKKPNITASSKSRVHDHVPRAQKEVQRKVQQLKNTRDYSFLFSENSEIAGPSSETKRHFAPPSKSFTGVQASRHSQVPQKVKSSCGFDQRNNQQRQEHKSSVIRDNQRLHKPVLSKTHGVSNSTSEPVDTRKHVNINGRTASNVGVGSKASPSNQRTSTVKKNIGVSSSHTHKSSVSSVGKSGPPLMSKRQSSIHPSAASHRVEMRKPTQEYKANAAVKRPIASDQYEVSKIVKKQIPSHAVRGDYRPKKEPVSRFPDDEDAQALQEIRKMFNTRRFADRDDDDSDMEANFDDILREERRSAKIGRREDEEQLRLIEEEERREQMRKMAKKRKLRD